MPLEEGKSQAAFKHNLKAELTAGKPKEQALAIAYAKKRGDAEARDEKLEGFHRLIDSTLSACDSLERRVDALEGSRKGLHMVARTTIHVGKPLKGKMKMA